MIDAWSLSLDLQDRSSIAERVMRVLETPTQGQLLSQILRLSRKDRRLSAKAVARAMKMPLRSYYSFEAGKGALDLGKVRLFSEIIDGDYAMMIFCLATGSLESLLFTIDNKAMSIYWLQFKIFSERIRGGLAVLPATGLIETFRRPFDELEDHLRHRDASTDQWLRDNIAKLFSPYKLAE